MSTCTCAYDGHGISVVECGCLYGLVLFRSVRSGLVRFTSLHRCAGAQSPREWDPGCVGSISGICSPWLEKGLPESIYSASRRWRVNGGYLCRIPVWLGCVLCCSCCGQISGQSKIGCRIWPSSLGPGSGCVLLLPVVVLVLVW